jgi:hypothetical protein
VKITRRQLRKIIREAVDSVRPFGTYATEFGPGPEPYYNDVIVMSPNGDSVLVDGMETYVQDVPQQLELSSGFPMSPNDADTVVRKLMMQMRNGYVELEVTYQDGKWVF